MTPSIRLGWMLQKGKISKITTCECFHQSKTQDSYIKVTRCCVRVLDINHFSHRIIPVQSGV